MVSDGICRACAAVLVAGEAKRVPTGPAVRGEVWRAALALACVVAWGLLVVLLGGCGETGTEMMERQMNEAACKIVDSDPRWARVTVERCYYQSACYLVGGVASAKDRDDLFTAMWERMPPRTMTRVDKARVQIYR
jgi:hypothetical protein